MQEATTKVYPLDTPRRSDKAAQEISHIPSGCSYFLIPLCCGFVAVSKDTASSPRLADIRKSLATRLECILEVGSNVLNYVGVRRGRIVLPAGRQGFSALGIMYFVYILKSLKDGDLYIGRTNDLKRRLAEHNSGKV